MDENKIRVNLGCGWRNFGDDWIHVDNGNYEHLDHRCDVSNLPWSDNYADLLYASHVIAYFNREEVVSVLKHWYDVLKPNGILRIATPDFESMVELYLEKGWDLDRFVGPLYGQMNMGDDEIYHKTTYDYESLSKILKEAGFKSIKKYDWKMTEHAHLDDHSQAYIPHMDKENGKLISLNIEALK